MGADAEVKIAGTGPNADEYQQVDPSHLAARVSTRPYEHAPLGGPVGGHYRMTFGYSNTAAKPAAASDIVSMRWVDSRLLFTLKSLFAWVTTTTTYTATLNQDMAFYRAMAFSVAASAGTQIIPIAGGGQRMRVSGMNPSLLGLGGGALWVSSGDLLTTGTRTLDTQPMGYGAWRNPITTPDIPVFINLFDQDHNNDHPLIFGPGEGFVVQTPIGNAQAAGVSKFQFVMEWAEVAAF